MMVGETKRRVAAILVALLCAILLLALFLIFRPLRLESPASAGARAMLRLDHTLGATVEPVDEATARRVGLAHGEGDLVVTSLAGGGPASAAGVRVGDIIESIGGKPADELSLTDHSASVSIWRGGKAITIDVHLGIEESGSSA